MRTRRATPRGTTRLSTLVVLVALVLLAFGGGSALAGDYRVQMCETPTGYVPADGLTLRSVGGAAVWYENWCGQPGGSIAISLADRAQGSGQGAQAEIYSGVPIVGMSVRQTVWLDGTAGADVNATPRFAAMAGGMAESFIFEQCLWFYQCLRAPSTSSWAAKPGSTGVHRVGWEVICAGGHGGSCGAPRSGGDPRATAWIQALDFTLRDSFSPSVVAGTVTGPAWASGAHQGVELVELDVVDYESGVSSVYAHLSGVEVGRTALGTHTCRDRGGVPGPDYAQFRPCPYSAQARVSVDTTRVPDGSHELVIYVVDASGNETRGPSTRITVDNIQPPVNSAVPTIAAPDPQSVRPNDALQAAPGSWSGNGLSFAYRWQAYDTTWTDIAGAAGSRYTVTKADVGKKLRVVVTALAQGERADAASAPTAEVQSGAVAQVASLPPTQAEGGEGGAPQLVVDREQRAVNVKHGAQIVVTGRLVDSDAKPIADATVDVFEQVTVVGAPWAKISTVRTDSQGGYAFRPMTTGSRVLRFAYAATRQAGEYRATREVVISVTAGMEIKALRRLVPAAGLIVLRGRVRATPLPAAGTWVEIQVHDAGIWRTVATRRTSKTGRWSFTHRVRRTSNVTFAFRARLRQLADVPSTESKSAKVKVRVR